jgi:mannose-6-phosphate isomerase-like protein (cupin superfamily)
MGDYTAMKIDDMEAIYGGAFKRARACLGVTSFGMQVTDLPAGFDRYPEHDHADDGQEEVYIALRGSADVEIDGEHVTLDPDTIVRIGPGAKRKITPGSDGIRMLALGGIPGALYDPHPATELGGPESF